MTQYIVLHRYEQDSDDKRELWEVGATVAAHSAADAIRAAHADSEGTFNAVPERSWNPTVVRLETTTKVRLEPQES